MAADREDWIETNRSWWDERVPINERSAFYDLDGFVAGDERLRPYELDEIGVDVRDAALLHLQCHIGTDTLAWARHGARVTGLDFSQAAIEVARRLAQDAGLADRSEFVAADVYDAVDAVGGRTFDVVYTGIGALGWLPDLDAWAEVVRSLLAPGGVLYVVEIHPILFTMGDDSPEPNVAYDYFDPIESDAAFGSYSDRDAETEHNRVFERNAGIGRVTSAVLAAGLQLELLHEHDIGVEQYWPFMVQPPGRPDLWIVPPDRPKLPLTWSLRARAAGS